MTQLGATLDALLGSVATIEARLAVTAGILLVTAAVGWLLLPRIVRAGQRVVAGWLERFLDGRGEQSIETLREAVPVSFGLRILVGLLQLALFALAAVAILALWGRFSIVVAVLPVAENAVVVGTRAALSVLLVGGAYVASDVLAEYVSDLSDDSDRITAHQEQLLTRIMQVGLLVIAGITILGIWGINLGGLLVGAGFLGIVLGMAARQTLGSLIAGLVLMFSRPFEIGDWVQIGEKHGIVTDITIVNTRLQTFDGEYVMLPNDYVGSNEVVNRSRKGRLRIHVEVGVDYGTDVEHAMEVAKETLSDLDDILSVPRPQVVLKEMGDSAVVLDMRVWIDKPSSRRRWRAQTAVIREVKAAFEREGIKIPFPQREVSGRAETGGFRVREQPVEEGDVADAAEAREVEGEDD